MRIKKIILSNYRQFKDIEITFTKKCESDLHIIIGKNGTGKTNILNALNWCLYYDEPHLSRNSQQLPLINLQSVDEAEDGEIKYVKVEVWVEITENRYFIFTRRAAYIIYKNEKNEKHPKKQHTEFEVKYTNERGNTNIIQNEEADFYVERFVPKAIREFFFFDGERLDNYFKEATAERIRHTITLISQVDLLENKIERRLSGILKEFRKEAGKENPEINETRINLEENENSLVSTEKQIKECKDQIDIAKKRIKGYEEKLREIPDIESLEKELDSLKISKKHEKATLYNKIEEKQDLLFEYGKNIILWPAIKNSIKIIEAKRKNKEIPPIIDKKLIEGILKNEVCICGRRLDDNSKKRVANLLDEIKLSSDIVMQLVNMENPLHLIKGGIKEFRKKNYNLTRDIKNYNKILEGIEEKMNQIDGKIINFNSEKIKEWYEDSKKFGKIRDDNQKNLGILEERKNKFSKNIEILNEQLKKEIQKEKKIIKIKKQIDFCIKSLDIVEKTKEIIREKTRERIESETNKIFFKLIWKKRTFKNIDINQDYNINLIHSMGYECLGTIGAAERELLALSFTLALHTISGFDSPILVDTPVARVADEHRENLGKIFSKVSKNKQIILLFTSAEYSKEISKLLDTENSNRFNFKLSENEKETRLEMI